MTLHQKQIPNYKLMHKGALYHSRQPNESVSAEIINVVRKIMSGNSEFKEYPNSILEAQKSKDWPDWQQAIEAKLDMLKEKGTWELIDLPSDRKAMEIVGYSSRNSMKKEISPVSRPV
jgi:hypothetical protein